MHGDSSGGIEGGRKCEVEDTWWHEKHKGRALQGQEKALQGQEH